MGYQFRLLHVQALMLLVVSSGQIAFGRNWPTYMEYPQLDRFQPNYPYREQQGDQVLPEPATANALATLLFGFPGSRLPPVDPPPINEPADYEYRITPEACTYSSGPECVPPTFFSDKLPIDPNPSTRYSVSVVPVKKPSFNFYQPPYRGTNRPYRANRPRRLEEEIKEDPALDSFYRGSPNDGSDTDMDEPLPPQTRGSYYGRPKRNPARYASRVPPISPPTPVELARYRPAYYR